MTVTAAQNELYSPRATIPNELFRRWLQYNVPVSFDAMKGHPDYKNLHVTFEFWTTAPISDESPALYEKSKSELNENCYKIELRSPYDVTQICFGASDPSLITAFEKRFMMQDGSMPPVAREPKSPLPIVEDTPDDFED